MITGNPVTSRKWPDSKTGHRTKLGKNPVTFLQMPEELGKTRKLSFSCKKNTAGRCRNKQMEKKVLPPPPPPQLSPSPSHSNRKENGSESPKKNSVKLGKGRISRRRAKRQVSMAKLGRKKLGKKEEESVDENNSVKPVMDQRKTR